jgi:hypothetical protein
MKVLLPLISHFPDGLVGLPEPRPRDDCARVQSSDRSHGEALFETRRHDPACDISRSRFWAELNKWKTTIVNGAAEHEKSRRCKISRKHKHIKDLKWCPEADLNHRHADFQSAALPTELSGHLGLFAKPAGLFWRPPGYIPGSERGYNILFGHVQRLKALF